MLTSFENSLANSSEYTNNSFIADLFNTNHMFNYI